MTLTGRYLELEKIRKDSVSVAYHLGKSIPAPTNWHLMFRLEWPYLEATMT